MYFNNYDVYTNLYVSEINIVGKTSKSLKIPFNEHVLGIKYKKLFSNSNFAKHVLIKT